MSLVKIIKSNKATVLTACAVLSTSIFILNDTTIKVAEQKSYIVSTPEIAQLNKALKELAVEPTHQLPIISSLAVNLTDNELSKLKQALPIKVTPNFEVEIARNPGWRKGQRRWQPLADVNKVIDAHYVHASYNFGDDVTIGFLDTGLDQLSGLSVDLYGNDKAWGTYDAVNNSVHNYDDESNGHGTHVASVANNSDYDIQGNVYGVAPNAAIVGIKAFDEEGKATYADVIRGIDWAVEYKDAINLRVLNMSFSGPVRSFYWDDPLNIAVMKAWQAGIVVVASAGNSGPEPMTIGVPGNVPYIITVGAMTDAYTTSSNDDDVVATFSSAGPTVEGFVKPEILAPGGHIAGLMSFDSQIVTEHPEFHDGGRYFEMSGTSQAAAVVSGVVALLLKNEPNLSPDQVKCRLMDSAKMAFNADGSLAYSVFQQGAGVVNAYQALTSSKTDCANQELNIAQDLAGEQHFYGPANIDEQGNYYIEGLGDAFVWHVDQSQVNGTGFIWKNSVDVDGFIWKNSVVTDGFIWKNAVFTDGFIWKNSLASDGFIWKNNVDVDGFIWKNSVDFSQSEGIAVNHWVEQQ